jgi:hypothetical protein
MSDARHQTRAEREGSLDITQVPDQQMFGAPSPRRVRPQTVEEEAPPPAPSDEEYVDKLVEEFGNPVRAGCEHLRQRSKILLAMLEQLDKAIDRAEDRGEQAAGGFRAFMTQSILASKQISEQVFAIEDAIAKMPALAVGQPAQPPRKPNGPA